MVCVRSGYLLDNRCLGGLEGQVEGGVCRYDSWLAGVLFIHLRHVGIVGTSTFAYDGGDASVVQLFLAVGWHHCLWTLEIQVDIELLDLAGGGVYLCESVQA